MEKKIIKEFVLKELAKFKLKGGSKGYKYLLETIYMCILNNDNLDNLSQSVFPVIAQKYKEKSANHVKWCIDKIIQTMYNNTDMKVIANYFGLDYNVKPSLKFVVYTIVCNYNK